MLVSDYIVAFLISRGISDVFGYPGGMVTHLMDALKRRESEIRTHINYHEQAAAFAACAFGQLTHRAGVAFATSGPGATNLITGVCNAYFDSIPAVFITGQVNTTERKGSFSVRQRGFQETDIVSIASPVTKLAVCIERPEEIPRLLRLAFDTAVEGRPGPVLLDIPMDVQRAEIKVAVAAPPAYAPAASEAAGISGVWEALRSAKRPCLLVGAGVHAAGAERVFREITNKWGVPVVTTMPAVDLLPSDAPANYGFAGSYGMRTANFVLAKADLLLSVGARLDIRQVGVNRAQFAENAKIIRVDVDAGELAYPLHAAERQICMPADAFLQSMAALPGIPAQVEWRIVCDTIRDALAGLDDRLPNRCLRAVSALSAPYAVVTTDVGQNQVWTAQSWQVQSGQRILFSGGHGAMGYSLPAAIGAHYATGRPVVCITGDGGLQMNVQELAFVAREKLPITIVALNNRSLGMIRQFQEMYFSSRFAYTVEGEGYAAPDFCAVARAYGVPASRAETVEEIRERWPESSDGPHLLEILLTEPTHTYPKLEFGKPNQDQEPLLDRALYHRLLSL